MVQEISTAVASLRMNAEWKWMIDVEERYE